MNDALRPLFEDIFLSVLQPLPINVTAFIKQQIRVPDADLLSLFLMLQVFLMVLTSSLPHSLKVNLLVKRLAKIWA